MTTIKTGLHWLGSVLNAPLISFGHVNLTGGKILMAVLIVLVAIRLAKLTERLILRLTQSNRAVLSESGLYALSRILRYSLWALGGLFAIQALGIDISSLALFGGAIGVGIGFGLQNIFSNFISGIVILLEKTLKVGDFVDLQSGLVGRVSEINVRYTRITTNDNVDVIVPNSEFINGKVTNWTLNDRFRRIHVPFGVAYGSDKDKVREAGLAAAAAVDGTVMLTGREPDVWLVNYGNSSLDFELVVWIGPEMVVAPQRTQARYLWALEDALRERGIEIPFPQRDLHIRSGTLQVQRTQDKS